MAFKPVYVVDGARTPFLKARTGPGPFAAGDLAVQAGRGLLLRQPYTPTDLDEVIVGCAAPSPDEVNIGRVIALRLGCGDKVPGWTVMRNCASGMQALDSAIANIQTGRSQLVLAGGVDALSRAPVLFSDDMALAGRLVRRARPRRQARHARPPAPAPPGAGHRPAQGPDRPGGGPVHGPDRRKRRHPLRHQPPGHGRLFGAGHARAGRPRGRRAFAEIAPLIDTQGKLYAEDDGVRADSTPDKLAKLKPVFDKPWGNITAGNSSQVTDGAAMLVLASEEAVRRWNLQPLGRIVDSQWAGLDPAMMGLGPVHAATPILQRHGLGLNDLDLWEINEAFAAQVLGCLAAWQDDAYCQEHFGTPAWGALDPARLNVDGGAIAIGHPVGASGARIVLHLLDALKRRGARRGMAAICIGGGLGGAMLVETLEDRQ